jgi:hypothetical protein
LREFSNKEIASIPIPSSDPYIIEAFPRLIVEHLTIEKCIRTFETNNSEVQRRPVTRSTIRNPNGSCADNKFLALMISLDRPNLLGVRLRPGVRVSKGQTICCYPGRIVTGDEMAYMARSFGVNTACEIALPPSVTGQSSTKGRLKTKFWV